MQRRFPARRHSAVVHCRVSPPSRVSRGHREMVVTRRLYIDQSFIRHHGGFSLFAPFVHISSLPPLTVQIKARWPSSSSDASTWFSTGVPHPLHSPARGGLRRLRSPPPALLNNTSRSGAVHTYAAFTTTMRDRVEGVENRDRGCCMHAQLRKNSGRISLSGRSFSCCCCSPSRCCCCCWMFPLCLQPVIRAIFSVQATKGAGTSK